MRTFVYGPSVQTITLLTVILFIWEKCQGMSHITNLVSFKLSLEVMVLFVILKVT